jgi:predicted AlkP superfamily phosphohydrolase/phosphomutase
MTTSPRRLLMVGLDAINLAFVEAHLDQLPNIAAHLRAGPVGEVTGGTMTGAVWPSFYTGDEPETHGIIHHLQWDPAQMRIRRSTGDWLPTRPFWRDLGERGVKAVALDIPYVFPGPTPAGVTEVMNWGTHDTVGPFWASDKALEREIRARFGLHPMGFEVPVRKTRGQLEKLLAELEAGAATKGRLAAWLMRRQPWDLFLMTFGESHRGGHILWPDSDGPNDPAPPDALLRLYKAIDGGLGDVMAAAGPDTDVVLFCLHGMEANTSQSHVASVFIQRAVASFRRQADAERRGDPFGVMRALRQAVPPGLQIAIAGMVPMWVRDFVVARSVTGGYDWADTYGFCIRGDLAGYLRFNIAGREAAGAIPAGEVEALKAHVRAELEALTLPDGRPVVKSVTFPATEWSGPRQGYLPDVLIEWNPYPDAAQELRSPTLGRMWVENTVGRGGNHNFRGFWAHRGPRQPAQAPTRRIVELSAMAAGLVP